MKLAGNPSISTMSDTLKKRKKSFLWLLDLPLSPSSSPDVWISLISPGRSDATPTLWRFAISRPRESNCNSECRDNMSNWWGNRSRILPICMERTICPEVSFTSCKRAESTCCPRTKISKRPNSLWRTLRLRTERLKTSLWQWEGSLLRVLSGVRSWVTKKRCIIWGRTSSMMKSSQRIRKKVKGLCRLEMHLQLEK